MNKLKPSLMVILGWEECPGVMLTWQAIVAHEKDYRILPEALLSFDLLSYLQLQGQIQIVNAQHRNSLNGVYDHAINYCKQRICLN